MSKAVLVCFRDRSNKTITRGDINMLSDRLVPDNITANPPVVIERDGILVGIINPNDYLHIKDTSFYLGHFIESTSEWWKPFSPMPDGAFALFRSDERTVELVSDIVSSRLIWYIQTEDMFIAATSQRAIIFFLQSFEPNRAALPWMLSSGCLGPDNSWDRRIKCVPQATRLRLDRESWQVVSEEDNTGFHLVPRTEPQAEKELREVLDYTFANLSLDFSKWAIMLSGGYDSREILMRLQEHKDIKCVTWGLSTSIADKDNDAYIAKQVAEHFGMSHKYYKVDLLAEPPEKIINRFILAGEGRVDHLGAYLDGFQIWKTLFESNILGVIRGDETLGFIPVTSEVQTRQVVGVFLLQDYSNIHAVSELIHRHLGEQLWPDRLKRKAGESLAVWRDRIYQEFRIPVVLSALTELKCSYVEVVSPYFSRRILNLIRTMPDSFRTDKRLFTKIVTADSPPIPFAKYSAIANLEGIFKNRGIVDLFSDALSSSDSRQLFSDEFVDHVIGKLKVETDADVQYRVSLREIARRILPIQIKGLFRSTIGKIRLDYNWLAFRMYIVGNMYRMLSEDASALRISKEAR